MTHGSCSPGFARLVQRALQEEKADLYESAEAMLKNKDMHEAIKSFDTDMQKAIEAQEAMMNKLLDEHAHALGELQNENEECKQVLLAQRGQTISAPDISDDKVDPESINFRETRLLQKAEAERDQLSEEMDAMARAHTQVTRQLLGQHEQKRVLLEENMRIARADWVRMEQQMRKDVNQFETKIVAERKRRSVDRERERQERMLEFEKNLNAVFSEDAVLPAASGGGAAQTKKRSERMSKFQQQLAAVFAGGPLVDPLAPPSLRERSISLAISRGDGGFIGVDREKERQERMLEFEKNLDAVFSEDAVLPAAFEGGAAQTKKQSEKMSKFQEQLATVVAEEPLVDPLARPRERSFLSAISRGDVGVGGGGSHLPWPPPVPSGGAWQQQRHKRPSVPGTTALQHLQQASLQDLLPLLHTRPQEPLVSKTFVSVLPYIIDEFTADLHTNYKQAVADTCCISIHKVFTYCFLFSRSRSLFFEFIARIQHEGPASAAALRLWGHISAFSRCWIYLSESVMCALCVTCRYRSFSE